MPVELKPNLAAIVKEQERENQRVEKKIESTPILKTTITKEKLEIKELYTFVRYNHV